jgi:hypothetical protein
MDSMVAEVHILVPLCLVCHQLQMLTMLTNQVNHSAALLGLVEAGISIIELNDQSMLINFSL